MDSEGSSASNSSSNSSENSQQYLDSPTEENNPEQCENTNPKASSRPHSRSSNVEGDYPRSPSPAKSNSDSSSCSSSSSDNENDTNADADVDADGDAPVVSKNSSAQSSRCNSSEKDLIGDSNGQQSPRSKVSNSSSPSHEKIQDDHENANISNEYLSDVSEMESEKRSFAINNIKSSLDNEETNGVSSVCEKSDILENIQESVDLRHKLEQKKNTSKEADNNLLKSENNIIDGLVKTNDEDALDFEAEEGECQDFNKDEDNSISGANEAKKTQKSDGEEEELEEGEVSDEDEKRPEETEPKPVCRFYTRGQCTWGMSCRFLHPGVTDKGNYTMFDLVRPIPVSQSNAVASRAGIVSHPADYHDYRTERPVIHRSNIHSSSVYPSHSDPRAVVDGPVVVESAWERGLRTAKEMMRKANKRKEQDMDFEDKKMNLTLSPDELEKESYYLKDRGSPAEVPPVFGRHAPYHDIPAGIYSSQDRYGRIAAPPYDEVDPYGRSTRYRELPPHRMPQYEDERRVRPTREVIVQRVEPLGRGDEWNDPWMRSKSPGGSRDRNEKRRRERRSYSSNSSYTSSTSSQSDSSSDSSKSPSPSNRRRYNSTSHKSPTRRRHVLPSARSPSSLGRPGRFSPISAARSHISPSALLKKHRYSPISKHKKQLSSLKKSTIQRHKGRNRPTSSSSGSGSSDTSGSDSESDSDSSSSESSSHSRDRTPPKRSHHSEKSANRKVIKKVEAPKKRSPITIELKKPIMVGASALGSSPTHSTNSEKDTKKTRREELLKQLRAVEDAIAKKRSKLA